jgi:hypothetical protein
VSCIADSRSCFERFATSLLIRRVHCIRVCAFHKETIELGYVEIITRDMSIDGAEFQLRSQSDNNTTRMRMKRMLYGYDGTICAPHFSGSEISIWANCSLSTNSELHTLKIDRGGYEPCNKQICISSVAMLQCASASRLINTLINITRWHQRAERESGAPIECAERERSARSE